MPLNSEVVVALKERSSPTCVFWVQCPSQLCFAHPRGRVSCINEGEQLCVQGCGSRSMLSQGVPLGNWCVVWSQVVFQYLVWLRITLSFLSFALFHFVNLTLKKKKVLNLRGPVSAPDVLSLHVDRAQWGSGTPLPECWRHAQRLPHPNANIRGPAWRLRTAWAIRLTKREPHSTQSWHWYSYTHMADVGVASVGVSHGCNWTPVAIVE